MTLTYEFTSIESAKNLVDSTCGTCQEIFEKIEGDLGLGGYGVFIARDADNPGEIHVVGVGL